MPTKRPGTPPWAGDGAALQKTKDEPFQPIPRTLILEAMKRAQQHLHLVPAEGPMPSAPHSMEGLFQRYVGYGAICAHRILGRDDEAGRDHAPKHRDQRDRQDRRGKCRGGRCVPAMFMP